MSSAELHGVLCNGWFGRLPRTDLLVSLIVCEQHLCERSRNRKRALDFASHIFSCTNVTWPYKCMTLKELARTSQVWGFQGRDRGHIDVLKLVLYLHTSLVKARATKWQWTWTFETCWYKQHPFDPSPSSLSRFWQIRLLPAALPAFLQKPGCIWDSLPIVRFFVTLLISRCKSWQAVTRNLVKISFWQHIASVAATWRCRVVFDLACGQGHHHAPNFNHQD